MDRFAFLNKDLLFDDTFFVIKKREYNLDGDLESILYSIYYVTKSLKIVNTTCIVKYKYSSGNEFLTKGAEGSCCDKEIKATISLDNDVDNYVFNRLSLNKNSKDEEWSLNDDRTYVSAYELFSRKDSIVEIDSKINNEKISIYFNNNLINFSEWVKRSLEQEIKSEPGKNIVAYKESDIINIGRYICYDIMNEASSFKTVDELEQIITDRFSELCPRTYRR